MTNILPTQTGPQTLLKARQLVKRYGQREVVKGIDLTINEGEIVALIGPNGAGKSTTLEMTIGLRIPDSGTISFGFEHHLQHIGVQLQTTPFFRGLTTAENLTLFAHFYGVRLSKQQVTELLARCGLSEVVRTEAARLSGGQQKRLAIAMTLAHNPRLIFLDEPTAALDPQARHDIRQLIRSLSQTNGTTVVFSSHDMEEVNKLAHRIILIVDGRIRAEGTPQELLTRYEVNSLEDLYIQLTTKEEVLS